MATGDQRASRLSGCWAFLTGGAAITLLLVVLDPITRPEDCANYGGNGNASAFDDPGWDLGLLAILLSWVVLVTVEQVLPVTRRHRGGAAVAVRGVCALALTVVAACGPFLSIALLCH